MAVEWSALTDALFSATMSSESITYSRGTDSVVVSAFRNTQTAQYASIENVEAIDDTVSFRVRVSEMLFSAVEFIPAKHDKIVDANGMQYDVQYYERDGRGLTYNINTTKVDL
jgi:hypothetical protein